MIKLVYCITKKASLTGEEFFRYWESVHGPIGARIPRLRKLVQSRRLTVPGDRYRPDYDGMTTKQADKKKTCVDKTSSSWGNKRIS
jgi:hypothetical protein